ncbi:restriction endonuclease subunit S [Bremerella sp. JC817]|uniref:restriction endonuclease subunit S n=1 Tax=Bremerella sp. JC817 TaxID=3231756 RepID=UPI003457F13E
MIRWDIPDSWKWTNAGEIAEVVGGGTPPSKDDNNFTSQGTPWITPADLTGYQDAYIARGKRSLSEVGLAKSSAKVLPKGTVLYTSRAPIGYCAIAENPIATNQGFKNLVLGDDLIPEFVRHYLLASKEYAESISSGTTFKELSASRMKGFEIPIAPTKEQRRIVAKIEALQERSRKAREALSEVGPLLEQFRQSLLAAAFRGDLTADWRAENPDVEPASQLLARIRQERRERWEQAELAKYEAKGKKPPKGWKEKYQEPEPVDDSELPELPEGWCWGAMEELCTNIVDCPHSTPKWTDSGKLCVRTTEFRPGRLDLTNARFVSEKTFEERVARLTPEPGDILYSREGGILGIACQIPDDTQLCLGQRMMVMRPTLEITASFVMNWLNSPYVFLDRVKSKIQGAASPHINVGEVKRFPVPVPSSLEQARIAIAIQEGMELIDNVEQHQSFSEKELVRLDQSILAKAFRGELVPQDPNDEPASVLLDRIREQREAAGKKAKKPVRRKRKQPEGQSS